VLANAGEGPAFAAGDVNRTSAFALLEARKQYTARSKGNPAAGYDHHALHICSLIGLGSRYC
jgi:hypothetical protein